MKPPSLFYILQIQITLSAQRFLFLSGSQIQYSWIAMLTGNQYHQQPQTKNEDALSVEKVSK